MHNAFGLDSPPRFLLQFHPGAPLVDAIADHRSPLPSTP
jgi:hypothetical protein